MKFRWYLIDPDRLSLILSIFSILIGTLSLVVGSNRPLIALYIIFYTVVLFLIMGGHFNTDHLSLWGLGFANLITLVRTNLLLVIIWNFDLFSNFVVSTLIFVVYALDKVDGIIARSLNETSKIGALLDNESDAILTLLLILTLYIKQFLSPLFLIIGFLRYFYIILLEVVPFESKEERPQQLSIVVSTIFVSSLIWLWTFDYNAIRLIASLSAITIIYTFIRDFLNRIR